MCGNKNGPVESIFEYLNQSIQSNFLLGHRNKSLSQRLSSLVELNLDQQLDDLSKKGPNIYM